MKLSDYLAKNKISPNKFGEMLGVKSRMTIYRYLNYSRVPSKKMMQKIFELTEGQVTWHDFSGKDGETAVINEATHFIEEIPVKGKDQKAVKQFIYPWSRISREFDKHTEQQFEQMMAEPPEGYSLSPVLKRAVEVLGKSVTVINDRQFKFEGRPIDIKTLVRNANKVLLAKGENALFYPGVQPVEHRPAAIRNSIHAHMRKNAERIMQRRVANDLTKSQPETKSKLKFAFIDS